MWLDPGLRLAISKFDRAIGTFFGQHLLDDVQALTCWPDYVPFYKFKMKQNMFDVIYLWVTLREVIFYTKEKLLDGIRTPLSETAWRILNRNFGIHKS